MSAYVNKQLWVPWMPVSASVNFSSFTNLSFQISMGILGAFQQKSASGSIYTYLL